MTRDPFFWLFLYTFASLLYASFEEYRNIDNGSRFLFSLFWFVFLAVRFISFVSDAVKARGGA